MSVERFIWKEAPEGASIPVLCFVGRLWQVGTKHRADHRQACREQK
jgi:hypothetical protein